jgi:hypothetical protein
MASSDHFRDKTAKDRPQASSWLIQPFGLAKRSVAKNGMDFPANNPPFLSANPRQRFQGRARSADALVRFPLHDRLSRWGWQKDRWQKKGSFSCPHSPANNPPFLSANPRQRFQGRIGRRMEAKEWLHRIISVTGRLRTPSSASLSMTDSAVGAGKKIGGKKQDHSPALILLPMISPIRSATPFEYQDKISRST